MLVFIMTILLSGCTAQSPRAAPSLLSSILWSPNQYKHAYPLTPWPSGPPTPIITKGHPPSAQYGQWAAGSILWTLIFQSGSLGQGSSVEKG